MLVKPLGPVQSMLVSGSVAWVMVRSIAPSVPPMVVALVTLVVSATASGSSMVTLTTSLVPQLGAETVTV